MRYDWHFEPDETDIAVSHGFRCPVRGGACFKTESQAIWHGKKWLKSTGRTGTITAIPAKQKNINYILDY